MSNVIIAPSILSSDLSSLLQEAKRVVKGGAEWIHLDIMVKMKLIYRMLINKSV